MEDYFHKKEFIFNFLKKPPNTRTKEEIKTASKYLSEHYQYFIKLKEAKESEKKIEKIVKFAKLEVFLEGETIIKYGEFGDKFYIILKGSVSIYKPIYIEKQLTPVEFSNLLIKIRDEEKDVIKYERLIQKNNHLHFKVKDIEELEGTLPNYLYNKTKIYLEDFVNFGEYGEGFSFGEMALRRKSTRNATIKAVRKSYFMTLNKKDYNNAMKELEEKKLSKDVDIFVTSYPIFNILSKPKILDLLSNFSKKIIYRGEYLYKQNEDADTVYFLNSGTINLSLSISFPRLNQYLYYFNNIDGNILFYIFYKKPTKYSELFDILEKAKNDMNKLFYMNDYMKIEENTKKWEESNEKVNEDNLLGVKFKEEKLNDENKLFNVNLKNAKANEMLGIFEPIESKKRFFSAKCVTEHAELSCIRIFDLMKIISTLKEDEIYDITNYIFKKKFNLKRQLMNALKFLEKDILTSFNNKYDFLIGDENNIKNEDDKSRIISVIRMKGFKSKIQELLDKDLAIAYSPPLLKKTNGKRGYWNKSIQKYFLKANKKYLTTLKKIYNTSFSNPHIVKLKNKRELSKDSIYKTSYNFYSSNNNIFSSPRKTIMKNTSFSSFMNSTNNSFNEKNDNLYNSYFSSTKTKNSKDKNKLFLKIPIFKNFKLGKKNLSVNKLLSAYTSPIREVSSNYSESTQDNKKKPISKSIFKIKNSINKESKIVKLNKQIFFIKTDTNESNNKDNNNEKKIDGEFMYYNKIKNNPKDLILSKKFNKMFNYELRKIKPFHYKIFYNK